MSDAVNNCNTLKNSIASEVSGLEDSLQNHVQKLNLFLEEVGKEAKQKTEEVTKSAISNIGIINNNLKTGMNNIDDAVDLQIRKMDEALAKHNKDIAAFIKVLEEKADGVNKKFTTHGELINQELDRLMVRSSNLEDAVTMQVSNLSGVSDKAIAAMQEVENALSSNVSVLDEKVLAANGDVRTALFWVSWSRFHAAK